MNIKPIQGSASQNPYVRDSVFSWDGTQIFYRQFGSGPGLVILHGTASSGYNHVQLARLLAGTFTVYVPDRRCHTLGYPFIEGYGMQQEVRDLDALLSKTGAKYVFGVSSGGMIALQSALDIPSVRKAAVFEPPFFVKGQGTPSAVLERYDREMARGRTAAALVTGMLGARMGPAIFKVLPRGLLERLTDAALRGEDKKGSGEYLPMRSLAAAMHYDFRLVVEMNAKLETLRAVQSEVFLLGGSKSPDYLRAALDVLEKTLPDVRRIELPGLGHAASWNTDRGGHPEPVALALHGFFA